MSFLKSLRTVEPSQTLLINEQSRLMQSQGKKIYKFGFGQSPFQPPERVINALKENGLFCVNSCVALSVYSGYSASL